ncbi:hypothetical protein L9F63_013289 [Diploptera punctata]|uniref:Uncharacterized protein n=1 Tax=Diploptera punctata TaxID=6984 RepID=A0AAD8AAI9_DIPPU|nr:hypothetical protein L9F63_013289 [Diploptera punctata]
MQRLHREEKWSIILKPYTVDWYRFSGEINGCIFLVKKNDFQNRIADFLNMLKNVKSLSIDNSILIVIIDEWLSTTEVREIINVVIANHARYFAIFCRNEKGSYNVFTWNELQRNVFHTRNSIKSIELIATCNSDTGFTKEPFFNREKNIINMESQSFLLKMREFPPFSFSSPHKACYDGMTIRLLSYIGKHMNTSENIFSSGVHKDFNTYGVQYDIHILIENSHICYLYDMASDKYIFYYALNYHWFTQRSEPHDRWASIFRVFTIGTWFFIVSTLISASIIFKVLHSLNLKQDILKTGYKIEHVHPINMYHNKINKYNYLLNLWSILLGMGVNEISEKPSIRIFFMFWIVFSLALSTLYQTFVVSYFFDPGFKYQLNTYEELKDLKYELVFDSNTMLFTFMDIYSGTLYIPEGKMWEWDPIMAAIRYIIDQPNSAMFLSEEMYEYYFKKTCISNEIIDLHKFTSESSQKNSMILVSNPLLKNRIRILMSRLVEAGFPKKILYDIIDPTGKLTSRLSWNLETEYIQMALGHLQSILLLYLIGNLLAFLILILEILIKMRKCKEVK